MKRLALVLGLAVFGFGCASTSALERRVAQLEAEVKSAKGNASGKPLADGSARPGSPAEPSAIPAIMYPAGAQQPPFVAFVGWRPTFCDGPLCLEIGNSLEIPICELAVNGERAVIARGRCIPPNGKAYVRLPPPGGRVTIEGWAYDTIRTGRGDRLPTQPLLGCRVTRVVGTVADTFHEPRVGFSAMDCQSVANARR